MWSEYKKKVIRTGIDKSKKGEKGKKRGEGISRGIEKRTEAIHPIHEWWIERKKIKEIKEKIRKEILVNISNRIYKKLLNMKKHIEQLPPNTFIPVVEEPFVFSTNPGAYLLVEDVQRLKLGLATTYHSHNFLDVFNIHRNYEAGEEDILKEKSKLPWELCNHNEAVHLCEKLHWPEAVNLKPDMKCYEIYDGKNHLWGKYLDIKETDLYGITLQGKRRYYIFGMKGETGQFNANVSIKIVADLYISPLPQGVRALPYILRKGFTPQEGDDPDFWTVLAMLLDGNLVSLEPDKENTGYELTYTESDFSPDVLENLAGDREKRDLLKSYFLLPDMEKEVEKIFEKYSQRDSNNFYADIFEDVLQSDRMRCDLPNYKMQMLSDPNRGSWGLWETNQAGATGRVKLSLKKSFYARDPRQDISSYGVIGIDFGTKSTVVTCLEDTNAIRPLRIGTGELDREAREEDYENPTVMEFRDIKSFLKAYLSKAGKPDTRWDDLDISHAAANNWKNNGDSDDCASFLGELKQWAGTDGKRIHIRDKKGHEETLPPYTTLQEGDFDPIELYAYYIGLYLNNEHTGKIYMRYLLSFPVTYAKSVREHILESFRRGLRKSLPLTVVLDEERMKEFRVEAGVGEPAAYAVCALMELHKEGEISLADDQTLFYGVFDFGGGTSDFDFGTWRKAKKDKKEKRYNYVIHHFGAGGKQYLGGENLLKKLAYRVFKENADMLREKQIPFVRPPECNPFPGDELIVNDSQEAETNTRRLMERLRPFWERTTEAAPKNFTVRGMSFFNASGGNEDAVELTVNVTSLENVLNREIKEGIKSFFDLLLQVRVKHSQLVGIDKCHILLAGRSSQSPLFQKLVRESINEYKKDFENSEKEAGRGIGEGDFFVLHGPLGDGQFKKNKGTSKKEKEPRDFLTDFYAPNGKTGVAVGLLLCRKGGKIRVISETDTTQEAEIPFQFYVGEDEDGDFRAILTPASSYEMWQEFEYAMETDNEFYYTTNPSAGLSHGNGLKVANADILRASCAIPTDKVNEDHMIYWRPVGPKTLEYVVAENEEKVKKGEYTYGPKPIHLGK